MALVKDLVVALQRIRKGTTRRVDYVVWEFVVWCVTFAWIKVVEALVQKFNPSLLMRVFMVVPALASVVVMGYLLIKCWRTKQ